MSTKGLIIWRQLGSPNYASVNKNLNDEQLQIKNSPTRKKVKDLRTTIEFAFQDECSYFNKMDVQAANKKTS